MSIRTCASSLERPTAMFPVVAIGIRRCRGEGGRELLLYICIVRARLLLLTLLHMSLVYSLHGDLYRTFNIPLPIKLIVAAERVMVCILLVEAKKGKVPTSAAI